MKTKLGLFSLLSRFGNDEHASSPRLLARLLHDEAGSYLLYMTLVIPILIGVAALGTEAGLAFYNHRTLQSAADAAAYSAAIAYSNNSSADITTQAEAIFANYGFVIGTGNGQANVVATSTTFSGLPAINVTVTRNQVPILSSLYLNSVISIGGSATAVISGSTSGNCVLALGNTATGNNAPDAIQLQGNPTINLGTDCGLFSNSTDCSKGAFSVALGGNAKIDAGSLGAAGCVSVGGNSSVNLPGKGTYTQNDGPLIDPYAGTTLPSSPAPPCVNQPSPAKGSSTITIGPGRYCGLDADGTNITLTGGTYILDCSASTCPTSQGTTDMLIVKNATLTDNGAGSTLVFTCSTCSGASPWASDGMLVASNGSVSLTAPTSGSTAGFVMMGDSTMPLGTSFDTHSNPNVTLDGTVYVPNGAFAWGGNPATAGNNFCLQFIVNTITLYGDSAFSSGGCSLAGGQKPIGSTVTLVE